MSLLGSRYANGETTGSEYIQLKPDLEADG
jgi:hypothetical protein